MEVLSDEFTASFNANVGQDSRGDLSKDFSVYEKKAGEARERTLKEAISKGAISEGLAEVAEVDTLKFWFAQVLTMFKFTIYCDTIEIIFAAHEKEVFQGIFYIIF